MVPSRRLLFFGVFLALFLCAPLAHAQQDASIIGTVTDETKAVLPGATVTATNLETGNQYSGVADPNGRVPAAPAATRQIQGSGGTTRIRNHRRPIG